MCSAKLDGIRCLIVGGKALTRKFKPIPNNHIRAWLEANCPSGLDGELMVQVEGESGNFQQVTSGIMSEAGEPDFVYNVFDYVGAGGLSVPFEERIENLTQVVKTINNRHVQMVEQVRIANAEELTGLETRYLSEGYEGVMTRDPKGPYKLGRSTDAEQALLKLKRFEDSEALVLSMKPLLHNANAQEEDAFGYAKRSTAKAGKVAMETCGVLQVRDVNKDSPFFGVEFEVGTGMDAKTRKAWWDDQSLIVGKVICYKFQMVGSKDKPRIPILKGVRDARDV